MFIKEIETERARIINKMYSDFDRNWAEKVTAGAVLVSAEAIVGVLLDIRDILDSISRGTNV